MIWWLGIGALAVINAAAWWCTEHPLHLLISGVCTGAMIMLLVVAQSMEDRR